MVNRISAKIIADSLNETGQRLTTYILTFPRIVLAEFNTHRMISKNSASSRAIPFKTMLKKVQEEPFIPIAFQKEHKGMQGTDYFEGDDLWVAQEIWRRGAEAAVDKARELSAFGVTKQLANRQLEPYLYHTVICTGTEWENFFALRAHPAAEIHIADLAEKMLVAYNESTPKQLIGRQYHIPFGDTFDQVRLDEMYANHCRENPDLKVVYQEYIDELKVKIAVARCARVSYLNFEGKDDYYADVKLYHILLEQGHMSPFEHPARAMSPKEFKMHYQQQEISIRRGYTTYYRSEGFSGNFNGFVQFRKTIKGENKKDPRVKTHIPFA